MGGDLRCDGVMPEPVAFSGTSRTPGSMSEMPLIKETI